jgi:putative restriction endonuclease
LIRKGINGLLHSSKLDREIWEEFNHDWNNLILEAHRLRLKYGRKANTNEFTKPEGPTEAIRQTKVRIHQDFFREAVLSSYNATCCVTGIRIPECLIASHIIPWSINAQKRTDPCNGLCLTFTFDRLFDHGFFTISEHSIRLSDKPISELISQFNGKQMYLPYGFLPDKASLEWHRKNVFRDK